MAEIELTNAIRALRHALEEAMGQAEGHRIHFEATEIELQLQIGATTAGEGSAGIKFWLLDLAGKASHASSSLQTLRLSLKPILNDGTPVRVTNAATATPLASTESVAKRD